MTFTEGCPGGRSQLFTFKAKETITVDRPTVEHIFALLNGCSANFKYLSDNDIFVFATKNYLASLDNPESGKALNLLSVWTDIWPEAIEELEESLYEAVQSIKFILAATAGGRND
jgi:hypothetical protein